MAAITCRQCGHVADYSISAVIPKESRVAWAVYPKADNILSAETIGGTLAQFSKLLKAVGRNCGTNVEVLVESMTPLEKGGVRFDCLVLETKRKSRSRRPSTPPAPPEAAPDA